MTTNFIGTLLTNSPTYTVTSGFSTLLYDAYGAQTVSVSSGGSLSLVGAMGANNIRLHSNADAWQVMRSGSTTIFIHTNGDRVEIPAIVEQQTISFADQSAVLRIETSGNVPVVKLGTQAIGTTASAITAWSDANPDDPAGSSELAPWTLVMQRTYSVNAWSSMATLISDGTAAGTHETIGFGDDYGPLTIATTPDLSKAVLVASDGVWSISSSNSFEQLTSSYIEHGYSINSQTPYFGIFGDEIAFIQLGGVQGNAFLTDGVAIQVANLDFGIGDWFGRAQRVEAIQHATIWTIATTQPYGTELIRIWADVDGLHSGIVKDIAPGSASGLEGYAWSDFDGAVLPDGRLVFSANDGVHDSEPWVSDGTDSGTFLLSDLSQDSGGSSPRQFTKFGNKVAFVAGIYGPEGIEDDFGSEIVFTNGTTEGTYWLDIFPLMGRGSYPIILGVAGDLLYFKATNEDGLGIFSTDGYSFTRQATISNDANLIAWTEQIAYFSASESAHGTELWALPLNGSGTLSLVKDILVGTGSALSGYNQSSFLVGDKLAFTAYDSATHEGFYLSDGTSDGTVRLGSHASLSPLQYEVVGNALYFSDSSGTYYVNTALATPSAQRIDVTSTDLQSDADQIYFLANEVLKVVDEEGTALTLASNVQQLKVFQENALYFIQEGSGGVSSLWYSNGTAAGTRYIEDLPFGSYDLANAVAIRTVGFSEASA